MTYHSWEAISEPRHSHRNVLFLVPTKHFKEHLKLLYLHEFYRIFFLRGSTWTRIVARLPFPVCTSPHGLKRKNLRKLCFRCHSLAFIPVSIKSRTLSVAESVLWDSLYKLSQEAFQIMG